LWTHISDTAGQAAGNLDGQGSAIWLDEGNADIDGLGVQCDLLFTKIGEVEAKQDCRAIIERSLSLLSTNCFAVVIIGDLDMPPWKSALLAQQISNVFEAAGAVFYNVLTFVTTRETAGVEARRMFQDRRVTQAAEQRALVFCMGDPRLAVAQLPEVVLPTK